MVKSSIYKSRAGFTLLELSVVLALIGLLTAGGISFGLTLLQRQQIKNTTARMDAVEKALLDYTRVYGNLPCPASITNAITAATFGLGTGTGSSAAACSAANFTSGNTVEGMIPVRTLQLPDSYALDGWGLRIMYAVDQRMTTSNVFSQYDSTSATPGSITIQNDSGGNITTQAVYALVSFGINGHGAYTSAGNTRRRTGSTDTQELLNCHCTSTLTSNPAYTATYVQKQITDSFDDIVRYAAYANLKSNFLQFSSAQ